MIMQTFTWWADPNCMECLISYQFVSASKRYLYKLISKDQCKILWKRNLLWVFSALQVNVYRFLYFVIKFHWKLQFYTWPAKIYKNIENLISIYWLQHQFHYWHRFLSIWFTFYFKNWLLGFLVTFQGLKFPINYKTPKDLII